MIAGKGRRISWIGIITLTLRPMPSGMGPGYPVEIILVSGYGVISIFEGELPNRLFGSKRSNRSCWRCGRVNEQPRTEAELYGCKHVCGVTHAIVPLRYGDQNSYSSSHGSS